MKLNHIPAPEYFICAKKTFEPNEQHVTRFYERSVLILMLSGNLRFLEDGKEISLFPYEYYIQRQRVFQEGLPLDDPPVYYYIEFNGAFSEDGTLPLRGQFDKGLIEPIFNELQISGNVFSKSSGINKIFALLCGEQSGGDSTAHQVKRFIDSNYAKPLSLSEIASHFGYTEDYITRLFKKEFTCTPHKHLANVRLNHALWLLRNTSLPAERIGEAVGYADFSSFWRAFKQKFSLSPGEIRKIKSKPTV